MTDSDEFAIRWGLTGTYSSARSDGAGGDRITACFDLMAVLLQGADLPAVLTLVAERAQTIAGAHLTFVALPGTEPNTLTIALAVGADAERVQGLTVRTSRSLLGRVFTSRRAVSSRVAGSARAVGQEADTGLPPGPILLLPLETGDATRGVLAVSGRPADLPFSAPLQRQLVLFASMAASLIELAEERRAAQQVTVAPWSIAAG